MGGFLEMANARLYRFWGDLTEGLRTGNPQNEIKHSGASMFDELYSKPERLEQFMDAMSGISAGNFQAFAEKFDFSRYRTLCDVGGAAGQLSMIVAREHPHLRCTSVDLPAATAIAERKIAAAGLPDRVAARSLDFFTEPLPKADVITMGMKDRVRLLGLLLQHLDGFCGRQHNQFNLPVLGLTFHIVHDRQTAIGPGADDQARALPWNVFSNG